MPGVKLDILGNSEQAQNAIQQILAGLNKLNVAAATGAQAATAAVESVGKTVEKVRSKVEVEAEKARSRLKQMSAEGLAAWQREADRAQFANLATRQSFMAMGEGVEASGSALLSLQTKLREVTRAYTQVVQIAAKVSAVVGTVTAVVQTGAAAWSWYKAKQEEALSAGLAEEQEKRVAAAIERQILALRRAGTISTAQTDAFLQRLGERGPAQRALAQELIALNPQAVETELLQAQLQTRKQAAAQEYENKRKFGDLALADINARAREQEGIAQEEYELSLRLIQEKAKDQREADLQTKIAAETLKQEILQIRQAQFEATKEFIDKTTAAEEAATEAGIAAERERLEIIAELDRIQRDIAARERAEEARQRDLERDREREREKNIGFVARMQDNLEQLSDAWGNLGRNAADALTNSIQAGVEGVTDAIMGAIEGTKTWGQVFLQVGRSIIASLIQVVVQWIAQMTIVRALQRIFHTEQTVQAGQRAVAEAPGAALASTASYGTAAIIGAVALAAVLALALAAAFGAFAEGGIVRGGEQLIRVNERGTEAVLNAQALANVGEGFVLALNAGLPVQQAAAVAPAAPAVKNQNTVNVVVFDDKARMNEYLQSAEGSAVVLDLMQKQMHNLTGKA